ncbi:hypothetical protein WCT56_23390, partial [Pectobacterium parmentieri]
DHLSEIQKGGIDYVMKVIESALKANKKNPAGFIMDTKKIKEMEELLFALDKQKADGITRVLGFVVGQGIDEKYKTIKNIVSPEGLQQITLWFGSQKTVNDAFGINIMTHSQVRNNGSIK